MFTPVSGAMHAPFTGVLKQPENSSEVVTADDVALALIRPGGPAARTRFEIMEPAAAVVLATGSLVSIWGPKYELMGPDAQFLLQLKFGAWTGPAGAGTVTLSGGRELYTRGVQSGRFTITDGAGSPVARFRMNGSSAEFALDAPLLTLVQAIGLAQILRATLETAAAA